MIGLVLVVASKWHYDTYAHARALRAHTRTHVHTHARACARIREIVKAKSHSVTKINVLGLCWEILKGIKESCQRSTASVCSYFISK